MGKNQWVSPRGKKWAVHGEKNSRDTKIFDTKVQAINHGKQIAKNQKSELIVQTRTGRIYSKDSYGEDPCPPKDKEH